MWNKIKKTIGLVPKPQAEDPIGIQVGVFNGRMNIKFSKKVDTVILDKDQLRQLLAAIGSQAINVK